MGKSTDGDSDSLDSHATAKSRNVVIGGVVVVVVLFMLGVRLGFVAIKSSMAKAAKTRQLAVDKHVVNFGLGSVCETNSDAPKDDVYEWDPVTTSDPSAIMAMDLPAHLSHLLPTHRHLQHAKSSAAHEQLASDDIIINPDMLQMTRLHSLNSE